MANEIKTTKWHGGLLIDIATREKVMKKFGEKGMSRSSAIERALEESVKEVLLTEEEWEAINDEIKANREKRMQAREAKRKGLTRK